MKRVLYKKIIILIREKYLTYLKYPPSKLKIDLIDIFLKIIRSKRLWVGYWPDQNDSQPNKFCSVSAQAMALDRSRGPLKSATLAGKPATTAPPRHRLPPPPPATPPPPPHCRRRLPPGPPRAVVYIFFIFLKNFATGTRWLPRVCHDHRFDNCHSPVA